MSAIGVGALVLAGSARATHASHATTQSNASRYGGTLRFRAEGPPDCLDPAKSAGNISDLETQAILDPLVMETSKGQIVPDLATSWQYSNGGKVITFKLRHGVKFSNGHPFNAAAVKWSLERVIDPKTASPNTGLIGPLKTVKVINAYTVRVIMKTVFRPLMVGLAGGYLAIMDPIAMKKEGKNTCQMIIGTGPFKIQSIGPAYNPITLVRNPYHTWETPFAVNRGKAYLDRIVFKPIVSDETTVSSLLSGGLDLAKFSGPQLNRVQSNKKIKLFKLLVQGENYMVYNSAHKPLNDPAVRRAIAEAIDRTALIKAVVNGLGIPALTSIPSTMKWYDKSAPSYAIKYNPTDAQKVLSAHHVTGPLTFLTGKTPTGAAEAELIQAELGQVGIKVKIVQNSDQFTSISEKGQFDLEAGLWTYTDPDILFDFFHSSQEANGGYNFTFVKGSTAKTLDKYIIAGRTTNNLAKAKAAYANAQRFMDQQAIIDPLWTDENIDGYSTKVHGLRNNFFSGGEPITPVWQDIWLTK